MQIHFEHHLFPAIPYRHGWRLHDKLLDMNFFESCPEVFPEHSISNGYVNFVKNLLFGRAAVAAPAVS